MVRPLTAIVGPTAVGKTAVGIKVAEALDGEIISADSRQIYRGMEIGTGAPSADELSRVRHHFIAEAEPDKWISAGEFARQARIRIDEVVDRGKKPIIVGGSGLYVKALIDGLAPMPPSDKTIRQQIKGEIDSLGVYVLLEELRSVDPDYYEKALPANEKRLIRALEVYRLTGKSFSDWHKPTDPWFEPKIFGLCRPRHELCDIIESRVMKMIDAGWIEELKQLQEKYGDALPKTVVEALGYRDLADYLLSGSENISDIVERISISTRQFAKRQMTWFRGDKRTVWKEETGDRAIENWTEWILTELGKDELKDRPTGQQRL